MNQPIGDQDGITAFITWLRTQPGVKPRPANYNPANISTWPMADKLERTLKTLRQDHDANLAPGTSNPPPASLFTHRYAYLRDPHSGYEVEKLRELRNAGYGTIALNIADHLPETWNLWRNQAGTLKTIPWARTRTIPQLVALRHVAEAWYAPGLIANLEQEDTTPRWLMSAAQVVEALSGYAGEVAISTEPWLPDNFDWGLLDFQRWTCLPQSLVNENLAYTPSLVCERARQQGWRSTVPSFGVYTAANGDPVRADYQWGSLFGIYTLDDLAVDEIRTWV